jgi:hypothetical protein
MSKFWNKNSGKSKKIKKNQKQKSREKIVNIVWQKNIEKTIDTKDYRE